MDEDVYRFYCEQLEWLRERDLLLAKIEGKLRAMRELAKYRIDHTLSEKEVLSLNDSLSQLHAEVKELEEELVTIVH